MKKHHKKNADHNFHTLYLNRKAYQSLCKPKTGTAINSATPSIPATSAFLPARLLLGADDDAPGALAVALSLAPPVPVDDPSEAVVEPDAVVVVVDADADVPVEVSLSDTVGRVKPPSLVLLVVPPRMPVGVGVASAAVSAQ